MRPSLSVTAVSLILLATPSFAEINHAMDQSWKQMVDLALALSSSQHNGQADIRRTCMPEGGFCDVSVYYYVGRQRAILSADTDVNDVMYSRMSCISNEFDDIMTCTEFDTNKKLKSMKGSDGQWHPVR